MWGHDFSGDSRAADAQIGNIRERVEPDPKNPRHALTVGYRFVELHDPANESSAGVLTATVTQPKTPGMAIGYSPSSLRFRALEVLYSLYEALA